MSTPSQESSAPSSICADNNYIERLEASLRRLRQRSTDFSWPLAQPLPLSGESADRACHATGTSRSRDQEHPAPLMRERRTKERNPLASLHDVLLFLSVGAAAASIAYLVARNERPQYSIAAEPGLAYAQTTMLPPTPVRQNAVRPTDYQTAVADSVSSNRDTISTAANEGSTPAAALPPALSDETVMLSSASEAQIEPANAPPHRLDPAEIQFLIDQGKKLMAAGDFVTARIVLRRAAQAGDSGAAFAMGGTYDPQLLKKIGAMGVTGDPDTARTWYEKAQQPGSLAAAAQTQSVCDSLQAALCRMSLAPQRHGARSHIRRQRN